MIRAALLGLAIGFSGPVLAQDLALPANAALVAEQVEPASDIAFPTAPWGVFDPVTARAEGTVSRRVWRIPSESRTTLQFLEPLREQLIEAGYAIAFECADVVCGGFDFRFALDLIGEPDMHVDLGDFRYLAATRGMGEMTRRLALVVSRSDVAGFVHLTTIFPEGHEDAPVFIPTVAPGPASDDVARLLEVEGHAVLPDLVFAPGSADLGPGPYASLQALSRWLQAHPDAAVILVGHTDASGALDRNIVLSRARAAAVRSRLIDAYGIAGGRLEAEGVGYLAPIAPNDTEDGRRLNRRVEVLLPATE
jgi:OOP family OmpA-OmpF porin